jgi:hypothetical protein
MVANLESLPTNRELTALVHTLPLARTYSFGWQGGFTTRVNIESSDSFEARTSAGVVQVSRGVLPLESVPRPVWDAEAVRHIVSGLVVAGHRSGGRPSEVVVQHLSQRTVVG